MCIRDRDYQEAINENTAALLKVHTSNFRIVGFTSEVSLKELVRLGKETGLPVIEDLGSGNFYDFSRIGLGYEPTVQEAVTDGADIVTFSGDKVLGGPQAGIIIGRNKYIDRIKKNPMNRALRIDKMTLAGLEATLRLYLEPEKARERIPTLAMITADPGELRKKGAALARVIRRELGERFKVSVGPGVSRVGGGAFPERDLDTTLVMIDPSPGGVSADSLRAALLTVDPPLIGRIEGDLFCLDVRTIERDEFSLVASALSQTGPKERG